MFEEIAAIHSWVRDFVEKEYPKYIVTDIEGQSVTSYRESLASRPDDIEFIEAHTKLHFNVFAVHETWRNQMISLDVEVASDSSLHSTIKSVKIGY